MYNSPGRSSASSTSVKKNAPRTGLSGLPKAMPCVCSQNKPPRSAQRRTYCWGGGATGYTGLYGQSWLVIFGVDGIVNLHPCPQAFLTTPLPRPASMRLCYAERANLEDLVLCQGLDCRDRDHDYCNGLSNGVEHLKGITSLTTTSEGAWQMLNHNRDIAFTQVVLWKISGQSYTLIEFDGRLSHPCLSLSGNNVTKRVSPLVSSVIQTVTTYSI